MDFIKKNYEKVLLGAVLIGLAVAAAFLQFMISRERQQLTEARKKIEEQLAAPLRPLNLSMQEDLLRRAEAPLGLDLNSTNKLFNPVQWLRTSDGRLIKNEAGNKVGPEAVVVTNITPLYLTITLDEVRVLDSGARYYISVEKGAAPTPALRAKKLYPTSFNEKNDTFRLSEVKGPTNNPTALTLTLNDSGDSVTLAKDRPFKRVDGYTVDLKYDPEKKFWPNRRVGDVLPPFAGDGFTIRSIKLVATNQYEVVLSARSNGKNTTIQYSTGP